MSDRAESNFGLIKTNEIEILMFRDKNLQREIAQVQLKLKALKKARTENSKKLNKMIKQKEKTNVS
jgi:hypothetical protein